MSANGTGPTAVDLAPGVPADTGQPTGLAPAAPGSKLRGLRAKRQAAQAKLHHDMEVPRMDGIWVRYRPIGSVEVNEITARIEGNHRIDKHRRPLMTNAAVLAAAGLGVFEVDEDDLDEHGKPAPLGDPATWLQFGPAVAEELGLSQQECPTAAESVIALYLTEGDLMVAAADLTTWSAKESNTKETADLGG